MLDVVVDRGAVHLVMEYVHGASLAELARDAAAAGQRAPIDVAVGVVADALRGLHAAHEARDARGAPLGIRRTATCPRRTCSWAPTASRASSTSASRRRSIERKPTAPGMVKGKLAYMPREQLAGGPVTRQADVYSAGVVLWELLTGRRLFGDDDAARVAKRLASEDVPAPSARTPGVSAALDAVVLRATSHDPRRRFETAAEMLAELSAAALAADPHAIGAWVEELAADALEIRAEQVRRVEAADLAEVLARAEAASAVTTTTRPKRRTISPWWVASAVVAITCTGALAAARAVRGGAPAASSSEPGAAASEPVAAAPEIDEPAPAPIPEPAADAIELPATATPAPSTAHAHLASKHRAPACDPPFSIDPSGRKHYKAECLR